MPDQDFKRTSSREPCESAEDLLKKCSSTPKRGDRCPRTPLTVEFLKTGATVCGDCGNPDTVPTWFDRRKHDRARKIFREHFFSFFFCHLMGLAMAVTNRTILEPLVYTGRSSSLPSLYRRYLSTLRNVKRWYEGDIWTPGDSAYESINKVRQMHRTVSHQLNGTSSGCPFSGTVYLSQLDMVITQFAFIGLAVLHPHRIGLYLSEEDFDCVLHFWRGVGYKLGIDDKYNLCSESHKDTVQTCFEIQDKIMKPSLVNTSKEGAAMSKNIIMAIRVLVVFLSYEAMMKFWASIIDLEFNPTLTLYDWWSYVLIKLTFTVLLKYKLFRDIFNYLLRAAIKRGTEMGDYLQVQLEQSEVKGNGFSLG